MITSVNTLLPLFYKIVLFSFIGISKLPYRYPRIDDVWIMIIQSSMTHSSSHFEYELFRLAVVTAFVGLGYQSLCTYNTGKIHFLFLSVLNKVTSEQRRRWCKTSQTQHQPRRKYNEHGGHSPRRKVKTHHGTNTAETGVAGLLVLSGCLVAGKTGLTSCFFSTIGKQLCRIRMHCFVYLILVALNIFISNVTN